MIVVGRRLLVRAVAFVADQGSQEVFTLGVLLVVLGAAWGAHEAGLSPPLGAFLAGMILGETRFRHRAEEDVRPFRDVLLGLFFVTVGLRVEGSAVVEVWPLVFAILVSLVAVKGAIVLLAARLMREPAPIAARAAVILGHGGEFGLLILTLELAGGALPPAVVQPLLGAIVLSMIAAPFLIRADDTLACRLGARPAARAS